MSESAVNPLPINNTGTDSNNGLKRLTIDSLKSDFEPNRFVQSSQLKKIIEEYCESKMLDKIKRPKRDFYLPEKPKIDYVPSSAPGWRHMEADSKWSNEVAAWKKEYEEPYNKKVKAERALFYETFTSSELEKCISNIVMIDTPVDLKSDATSKRQYFYNVIDDERILSSLLLKPQAHTNTWAEQCAGTKTLGIKTRLLVLYVNAQSENKDPRALPFFYFVVYEDKNGDDDKKKRRIFISITNPQCKAKAYDLVLGHMYPVEGGSGRSSSIKYNKSVKLVKRITKHRVYAKNRRTNRQRK